MALAPRPESQEAPPPAPPVAKGATDPKLERPAAEPEPAERTPRPGRRVLVALALLLGVGLAGVAVWRLFFAPPALPAGVIAVSGRIEGDDSAVSPKTSGRIREITVREGDRVEAGDVIATLD